jgi:hypothetical protein
MRWASISASTNLSIASKSGTGAGDKLAAIAVGWAGCVEAITNTVKSVNIVTHRAALTHDKEIDIFIIPLSFFSTVLLPRRVGGD